MSGLLPAVRLLNYFNAIVSLGQKNNVLKGKKNVWRNLTEKKRKTTTTTQHKSEGIIFEMGIGNSVSFVSLRKVFLRWPIEDMPHFILSRDNLIYRAINSILSRDKCNLTAQ